MTKIQKQEIQNFETELHKALLSMFLSVFISECLLALQWFMKVTALSCSPPKM